MRIPVFLASLGLGLAAVQPVEAVQRERPKPVEEIVCPADVPVTAPLVLEAPEQDYEPSPAMWKIADEDTTIYLFGTYHVLPEGFRWRTPLLEKVIAETEEVVFESREDEDESKMSEESMRFFQLMLEYRAEVPLSERLSKHNVPKFKKLLEVAGIPLSRAEYMPPLMTMFGIAIAAMEEAGSLSEFGVETILEAEYKASNRPISAIEDPIQVFENLFKIDEADLIKSIDEGLEEWNGCDLFDVGQTDWENEHKWAQGKLDGADLQEMFDDPFSKAFYDVLLVDRNREWAGWVKERMTRPGNLLLAVGAGHMEGPDSLVLMLEADDIAVERIQ